MHFKKMNKFFVLVLTVVFLFGAFVLPASAETIYNYTVKINGKHVLKFQSDRPLSYHDILSKVRNYLHNLQYSNKNTPEQKPEQEQPQQPHEPQQPQQPEKQTPAQEENTPSQPEGSQSEVSGLTFAERQMIDLVNKERVARGLQPLKVDMDLVKLARMKSQDMIDKGYFSHTSPTYGSPFEMMRKYGVSYRMAGENLAGAPTVELAHKNLMQSPGHRANILRPQFTHVGIGIVDGGPYGKMFTQMFIQK